LPILNLFTSKTTIDTETGILQKKNYKSKTGQKTDMPQTRNVHFFKKQCGLGKLWFY
jgi:hypothetical protein